MGKGCKLNTPTQRIPETWIIYKSGMSNNEQRSDITVSEI